MNINWNEKPDWAIGHAVVGTTKAKVWFNDKQYQYVNNKEVFEYHEGWLRSHLTDRQYPPKNEAEKEDDLTWLARNVHEWHQRPGAICYVGHENGYPDPRWPIHTTEGYTRDQWQQRRAELQKKPSWDDAPEWVSWIAQWSDGEWIGYEVEPECGDDDEPSDCYVDPRDNTKMWRSRIYGEVLGDWRNTLEKRPEKRELNSPTSSLTHAQAVEIAKETRLCNDGTPCGVINYFADDGYCDDCPKNPDHIADINKMVEHCEQTLDMVGRKADSDKPRMDLIPPKAEKLLAEVLSYGAQKYAPNNWKHVPDAHDRYIAAAMRHINSHRSGEEIDPESGLPHLAHAMCSLAFILELEA